MNREVSIHLMRRTRQKAQQQPAPVWHPATRQSDGLPTQRIISRDMFTEVCAQCPQWANIGAEQQTKIVVSLERTCHNTAIGAGGIASYDKPSFVNAYSACAYRLSAAILATNGDGEESLVSRIVNQRLPLVALGEANVATLDPKAHAELRENLALRAQQKVTESFSTLYRCKKCGVQKTKVETYRARSGDEGDCCMIKCQNCPHFWYV